MITYTEILMGRATIDQLSTEQIANLLDLLPRLNVIRAKYNKPLVVSSGLRLPNHNTNAGGAKRSAHMSLQAVDFSDPNKEFAKWCLKNMKLIKQVGLYLENPKYTPTWVHLQSRPTNNNPFNP